MRSAVLLALDGAPLDRGLLERLAQQMNARVVWSDDHCAFVSDSAIVSSPAAVAVVEGRIDDRSSSESDAPWMLARYERSGWHCVEGVIGEFVFLAWEPKSRTLTASRDPFGVRALYRARIGSHLLFCTSLAAMSALPELARPLDDHWIASLLLFGYGTDVKRTAYSQIARVPAAHVVTVTPRGEIERAYWNMPAPDQPLALREDDAVDAFRALLVTANRDRLRGGRATVAMSGGVDSTLIAATARQAGGELRASTIVFDSLLPDDERRFASMAGEALGIPVDFLVADRYTLYGRWKERACRGVEPYDYPLSASGVDQIRASTAFAPLMLHGEGGDALMRASADHFHQLLMKLRWGRFIHETAAYVRRRQKLPPLLLRSRLKRFLGVSDGTPTFQIPEWLDRDFAREIGAQRMIEEFTAYNARPTPHPWRAEAWRLTSSRYWTWVFEVCEPGYTGEDLVMSSPLFDLRVVEFVMALPAMPYFADKELSRNAGRSLLPDAVRLRPKTPLLRDPVRVLFERDRERWSAFAASAGVVERWVDTARLSSRLAEGPILRAETIPISLAMWLGEEPKNGICGTIGA